MSYNPAPPLPPARRSRFMFYWWRRFGSPKKLSSKESLLDRIKNGDFEASPYWEQSHWEDEYANQHVSEEIARRGKHISSEEELEIRRMYIKRKNKLQEDAYLDDLSRISEMEKAFCKYFGINKKQLYEFIEECDGSIEQLYYNIQTTLPLAHLITKL